jgi:hypothetical protein
VRKTYFICVLALLIQSASAAELVVRDATLAIEFLPTDMTYNFSDPSLSSSGSDGFESHYGIAAGARYSFAGAGDKHGFVVGGAITAAQASYGSVGHLSSFGLRAEGGYAWAFRDNWIVSGIANVSYGVSSFDITSNSVIPAVSASGDYLGYGASVEISYAISDVFHVGLSGGWGHYGHDLSGGNLTMKLDNDGTMMAIGFSYRLSNSPRSLE